MSKKSLFFSPDFRTLALAGAGFLTVTTAFSAFTMASKSKTFSSYFGSLNLNEQLQKFFPKAGSGISAAATSFTSLWSKVLNYIPGFSKLTTSLQPIWTKIQELASGIIPGFQGIGSYLVQGWGYLGKAWSDVYSFLSNNMQWKYLLVIPAAIYFSVIYFSDIAKTVWNYVKENLKDLSVFHWILTNLKKWLGTPVQQAKNLWESVKTIFYTFGYQWTKTALESQEKWDEVKKYINSWAVFQDTVSTIFNFFRAYKSALENISDENRKKIVEMFIKEPADFIKKLKALMTRGKASLNDITSDNILSTLQKNLSELTVQTTIKEVTETAKTITKDAIEGAASVIKSLFGGSGGSEGGDKEENSGEGGGVENVVEATSQAVQKTTTSLLEIIGTIASGVVDGVSKALIPETTKAKEEK